MLESVHNLREVHDLSFLLTKQLPHVFSEPLDGHGAIIYGTETSQKLARLSLFRSSNKIRMMQCIKIAYDATMMCDNIMQYFAAIIISLWK